MGKKGDVSSKMVVTVILIVAAFSIALFFYSQIVWKNKIDREACFNSVVYRALLPGDTSADKLIPLKCRTEKICVTAGLIGGSCKEFSGLKGITKVKVKSVADIEKAIAQNIVDCWGMMGEGRVSLFSQYIAKTYGVGFSGVYPSCVICSRIAFDMESLKKAGITEEKMSTMNVDNYMQTHLVPGKNFTYNEYIVGTSPMKLTIKQALDAAKTSAPLPNLSAEQQASLTDAQKFELATAALSQDISKIQEGDVAPPSSQQTKEENLALQREEVAVLFMQISAPSQWGSLGNIGKLAGGIALSAAFTAPSTSYKAGAQIGKLCVSGGWVGPAVCAALLVIAIGYQQGFTAYQRSKTAGFCSDVLTGTEARSGCTVVRTVDYNLNDINQYCAVIESIP